MPLVLLLEHRAPAVATVSRTRAESSFAAPGAHLRLTHQPLLSPRSSQKSGHSPDRFVCHLDRTDRVLPTPLAARLARDGWQGVYYRCRFGDYGDKRFTE